MKNTYIDFHELFDTPFDELDGSRLNELLEKARNESEENDAPVCEEFDDCESEKKDALTAYMRELAHCEEISKEEADQLALRYQNEGDREALESLIRANQRLVFSIAKRFRDPKHKDFLDLVQTGNVYLFNCAKNFDPERNVKFSSYAAPGIRGYNLNELKKIRKSDSELSLNVPLRHDSEDDSEDEFVDLVADAGPSLESRIAYAEMRKHIRESLAGIEDQLDDRERMILHERLLSDDPMTQQAIGDEFGVSRERVRQIEAQLLKRLRREIENVMPDFAVFFEGEGESKTPDKSSGKQKRRVCSR